MPFIFLKNNILERYSTIGIYCEIWFENIGIEINSGLVAIIGNKGNGKSALSDSIGLVGNTPNHRDFSFLDRYKFRAPRPNRAENFDTFFYMGKQH